MEILFTFGQLKNRKSIIPDLHKKTMTQFFGEYELKIDDKGRILFPKALRMQLSKEAQESFVLKKGFEECLSLHPKDEWQKISAEVNKLNPYVKQNRDFIRSFFKGAMEVELDAVGRLQLPKRMLEWAGIEKELVLFAYTGHIEIWDKKKFDQLHADMDDASNAKLAEEVMGKLNFNN